MRIKTGLMSLVAVVLASCGISASGPTGTGTVLDSADFRVMFVGNSLTYTHNVPAIVQALADEAGLSMAHSTVAEPNFSLEDHWNSGTADLIADLEPDVVVMQQGPSTLPENQEHLAHWAQEFDRVIRRGGGTSALYMVWPSAQRAFAFPDVWDSYKGAADGVGGVFMPAGQTWVEAWSIDGELPFWGRDGFHPSYLGALAAAQTIFAVIFEVPPDSIPTLDDEVTDEVRETLAAGLTASLTAAGYDFGS